MTGPVVTPASDPDGRGLVELGCGRVLGQYVLLRRVAQGGMAEIFIAKSHGVSGFDKHVAIKKILPQYSHNDRFVSMLVDEAKITVSLTHPNIAQVYELGVDGDDFFIVMEYVDGRPLNRLMQRVDERGLGSIPIEFAVHVMSEVAKGLDHAHKQKDPRGHHLGIVHRDVSPQNVLVSYQGHVKLIDFGIARAEGRINQTSEGVIKGKLRYLAPEIASGDEPDHRADIFCCGIVMFEMLTGEAMFAPRSDIEAINMATEGRVKSPRSRNSKVPEELEAIVMRSLARDRRDRYQTARELHSDLRRFMQQHHPSFLGSELGDFMHSMFAPEIEQDRELDRMAEQVADRLSASDRGDDFEEPTVASTAHRSDSREPMGGYRQLVTGHLIADPTALGAPRSGGGASEAEPTVNEPLPEVGLAPPPRERSLKERGRRARSWALTGLAGIAALLFGALSIFAISEERGGGAGESGRSVALEANAADSAAIQRPGARARDVRLDRREAGEGPRIAEPEHPRPHFRATGSLLIHARPRSTVYVGGRNRGKTPVRVRLPAGKHRIVLKGPDGQKRSFVREVAPGKKTTFTYRWQ